MGNGSLGRLISDACASSIHLISKGYTSLNRLSSVAIPAQFSDGEMGNGIGGAQSRLPFRPFLKISTALSVPQNDIVLI